MPVTSVEELIKELGKINPAMALHMNLASEQHASRTLEGLRRIKALALTYNKKNKTSLRYMQTNRHVIEQRIRRLVKYKFFVLVIVDQEKHVKGSK